MQPPLFVQAPVYDPVAFTRRLGMAMVAADIRSNNQLADLSGVHKTHVGKYRSGKAQPSLPTLIKMAEAMAKRIPGGGGATISALFKAAGHFEPPRRPSAGPPQAVRDHGSDPRVAEAWRRTEGDPRALNLWNSGVKLEPLLGMLEVYLAWRDPQPSQQRLAGLSRMSTRLATCGQINDRG